MPTEFAQPWFLLALAVPISYLVLRRPRATLRFPGGPLIGLPTAHLPIIVGTSLRFLALVALAIALAGPREPDLKTRIVTEGIAIVFVLDTSGSMQDESFEWQPGSARISRAEAVRRAFRLFVAGGEGPDGTRFEGRSTERGTDAVGLVTFSNWPQTVCPPTLNHSVLLRVLDGVEPPTVRDTGTNIGDALAEGVARLDKMEGRRKVLILLSDGEHNVDLIDPRRQPLRPRQAASIAANLGVVIHTIDAGGEAAGDDAGAEERRRAGRAINADAAQQTGGQAFSANDGSQLLDVCRAIDSLERQPLVSPVYRRHHEHAPWYAGVAAMLAAIAVLLDSTLFRRLP